MSQPSLDLFVDDTFSVSELHEVVNRAIRRALGSEGIHVKGEVAGLKEGRGGHLYFQLVEALPDGGTMALDVVFFAGQRARMEGYLRRHGIRLANGLAVRIGAQVSLRNGRLNAVLGSIDAAYTLGTLAMDRDALLRRLADDGLLERNRQRPLPRAPLRVGVVCAVGSAGHHDFLHELQHSGLPWELVVCDAQVQGDAAPAAIAAGVRALAHGGPLPTGRAGRVLPPVDVVCVVRGGGARTDLAAFDHEAVALAVAAARVPVLTGIGHEVDRSVADEVAHTALKTPTACAAFLVQRVRVCTDTAEGAFARIAGGAERLLARADATMVQHAHRTGRAAGQALHRAATRVDRAATVLERDAVAALRARDQHLTDATRRLLRCGPQAVEQADQRLAVHAARAAALDPAVALARGWSITRTADGTVVRHAGQVRPGDAVVTTLADGTVHAVVTRSEEPSPP